MGSVNGGGTNLFVKVPRPGDSEVTLPCPRTQQANLPAYLHTNRFKCWTSSREAVNTNF